MDKKKRGFLTRAGVGSVARKRLDFNGERTNKSLGLFGGVGLKGKLASWGVGDGAIIRLLLLPLPF
jgi:hypothetical protein